MFELFKKNTVGHVLVAICIQHAAWPLVKASKSRMELEGLPAAAAFTEAPW
jgi:hypothetical protein